MRNLIPLFVVILFLASCVPTQYVTGNLTKQERLELSGWVCKESTIIVKNKTDDRKYFSIDGKQVQLEPKKKVLFFSFYDKIELKVLPGKHTVSVSTLPINQDLSTWFNDAKDLSVEVETYPCFVYRHDIE